MVEILGESLSHGGIIEMIDYFDEELNEIHTHGETRRVKYSLIWQWCLQSLVDVHTLPTCTYAGKESWWGLTMKSLWTSKATSNI